MTEPRTRNVVEFAAEVGHAFLVTADAAGAPHVAVADRLGLGPANELAVAEWCCPTTLKNLEQNPRVAVIVWDPEYDEGYQVAGRVVRSEEVALQDGEAPELESGEDFPQTKRQLHVAVEQVLTFVKGRHRDRPSHPT
jgi:hypothetical protein